jgi:GNAT superfamily N-acetyltransferase
MHDTITIRRGAMADYDHLARFHCRPGRPATCVRVLAAEARSADNHSRAQGHGAELVGVLTVSMPAMNGPWRERVWPGRYRALEPTRQARRDCLRALNRELRVISRVIVEPRWRGRGVGRRLVRAYLDEPLTVHTESIAAMGRFCGVFEGAGMRALECEPSRRVVRFRQLLRELGIQPWRLSDPRGLHRDCSRFTGAQRAKWLAGLRTFALSHRDTRALADAPERDLITLAARRVNGRAQAYVWSAEWERRTPGAFTTEPRRSRREAGIATDRHGWARI